MNVLSCFDGMGCGRIALDRLGIPVTNYYASEIDKYAIQVSKANWPDIIHVGDITKLYGGYFKPGIDLLIGGSPCQGFSFAGKQLNFEDPRSKLFFEFVRLKNELQPRYWLLENVVMKKEYQNVISEALGVQPILINSALVSAQNRKRLYWTNIPFQGQPADRGILLKDILEDNCTTVLRWQNKNSGAVLDDQKGATLRASAGTDIRKRMKVLQPTGVILNRDEYQERNEKAMYLDANYYKGADNHGQRTIIQLNGSKESGGKQPFMQNRVYDVEGKGVALTATKSDQYKVGIVQKPRGFNAGGFHEEKSPSITSHSWQENNKLLQGVTYRKLTVTECARLQGVPDQYCAVVSNTQTYKMLGNGWNVDTIVHLFEPLLWLDIL
jgi:DNA-cytosine methyltransferase